MAIENEVRYLVTKMDPNFPLDVKPPWQIKQGYFDLINPNKHLRVRIINGQKAFLCTKEGKGYSREEEEERIGVRPASFLFNQCSSYLEKTRYFPRHRVEDGEWTIDIFKDPLGGIVIAEFEHQLPIGEVIL